MRRLLPLLPLFALACDPTGGAEVPFSFRVETASPASFVTATGWSVTLEQATLAAGPIYLHENPPAFAARSLPDRLLELVVPRAHAHAGDSHFNGGAVLGEWLVPFVFDAVSPQPLALGETIGNAGPVRSFAVLLEPPANDAGPTHGFHAWAMGVATKGEQRIPFEGGLVIERPGRDRRVEGLPVEAELADGGVFVLEVHADRWFRDAEFDRLTAPDTGDVRTITTDSQVHAAWFLGARSREAFSARWDAR